MKEKHIIRALVSYDNRNEAKKLGFKWFPDNKMWLKEMTLEEVQVLPFPFLIDPDTWESVGEYPDSVYGDMSVSEALGKDW